MPNLFRISEALKVISDFKASVGTSNLITLELLVIFLLFYLVYKDIVRSVGVYRLIVYKNGFRDVLFLFGLVQAAAYGTRNFLVSCITLDNFSLYAYIISTFLMVFTIYILTAIGRAIIKKWDHGVSGRV